MKKVVFIGLAVIFVAVGLVATYLISNNNQIENIELSSEFQRNEFIEILEMPESAFGYEIIEGSTVRYILNKRFLQQSDEEVIGVLENVNGNGWFDFTDGNGYLAVGLDFSTLKTDNAQRDANTTKTFNDTSIRFIANLSDLSIIENEEFRVNVPGNLTINGITQATSFNVVGTISSESLVVDGFSMILLSDFEVEPPSLAGMYTADNEIEIRFNVVAERIN